MNKAQARPTGRFRRLDARRRIGGSVRKAILRALGGLRGGPRAGAESLSRKSPLPPG